MYIKDILTIAVMLIFSVVVILLSRKYKPHFSITAIVLLIFLNVIATRVCWMILSQQNGDMDINVALSRTYTLGILDVVETILINALIVASLILSMRTKKKKKQNTNESRDQL